MFWRNAILVVGIGANRPRQHSVSLWLAGGSYWSAPYVRQGRSGHPLLLKSLSFGDAATVVGARPAIACKLERSLLLQHLDYIVADRMWDFLEPVGGARR